ncbi:alkaline phosphatase family protein [Sphingobacterium lumbrici]|uniref:alkaline phosphatase family protein n=1 Tax=Sphingobacterium lumbrici TaxID=2559600 RepID=UPI0015E43A16|nr:alkaline phosphatase family protein [Sphingobacterium lumbrici]
MAGVILASGCKQYDNPPPVFEELKDMTALPRKVLVISIDGLTGTELEKVAPTNIATLQKNGKYSYNTLKGASDAGGWVSMLTGTGFAKHQISSDNFERTQESDNQHGEIKSYRNVLDYVTQYKSVKTAMVTPWETLRNYVRNADYTPQVETDLSVKDSTVALLGSVQSLGTIFVNFRDVLEAGKNGGYLASNTAYKNAIVKSDEYIGNILTAVRARTNYEKEDWLIIVTTNHGGSKEDPVNGFTLVYHPDFKEFELKKTGFNGILFNPSTVHAEVHDDHGLYDAGATKDFTVQMDVKFNVATQYPGFLSKSTAMSGGTFTGWLWMQSVGTAGVGNWGIVFGGTQNGGSGKNQISNANGTMPISDGKWHTLTMTVKTTGGATPTARTMTAFIDGVQTVTGNLLNNRSLTVEEGLRVGYRNVDNGGTGLSTYSANLAYFDKALDASTIANTHGLKDITQHPDYANLIGFWPMDDGTEGICFNKAPGGYNMQLAGPYSWKNLADFYPPGTYPEPVTSSLSIPTTNSDIAALILYWMNIEILSDFGFDGKPYLTNFELEFLKE